MPECEVCYRKCKLSEGQTGFCGARICAAGKVVAANYGRITSAALDPIEKKPLRRFMPGAKVLSVGSYGCNLRCPFCQNHEISWSEEAMAYAEYAETVSPQELVQMALDLRVRGNVGIAYTYNEPLIGYEFVRDTAKLAHEAGLCNVLVTNGMASEKVLEEIGPYVDAMNIDLKAFTERFYREYIHGDLDMVKDFIRGAVKVSHVELTTLVIPGENDSEDEMRELSAWVASLRGKVPGDQIPLHVTRFFPQFHVKDKAPTPVKTVVRLAEVARENLRFVYTGNI
ncbi:MAG: AmmeMemoRadiSam system radical SAM enzyme [Lachnospiraceae bacterium]|nr:AmmeMemoRadiSam system radical SAM enzyme [Lachnospiraceae bacterium]